MSNVSMLTFMSHGEKPQAHYEILGTVLTYPTLFQEIKHLPANHFFELEWLFRIMREVDEKEGLTFKGVGMRLKTGQIPFLQELCKTCISESRLPILVREVKTIKLTEMLRSMAVQILENCGPENANDVLQELQQTALELHTTDSGELQNPDRDIDEFGEWMEKVIENPKIAIGITTGIHPIDIITTGYHRGDFIVVGARTSIGKSAFMIENAIRIHQAGYKVAIFSLEMSKRQIYLRMMANLMGSSLEVLRTGQLHKDYLPKFHQHRESMKGIYVDDTRGIDCEYISDVCRRLKRTQGLDFVIVDYLQDIKEKGEQNDNSGSAIARICRKLRVVAQQQDVPVMALSQVTRSVEERRDKRPTVSDLSGSTGIETSADVIALLYRDEYYNEDTPKKNILEINFAKQRNGKIGKVELYYDKECQRITPLARR